MISVPLEGMSNYRDVHLEGCPIRGGVQLEGCTIRGVSVLEGCTITGRPNEEVLLFHFTTKLQKISSGYERSKHAPDTIVLHLYSLLMMCL